MTSRLFEFVMRCLATGENCLPAAGIGAVARQLAAQLPPDSIHTGAAPFFGRQCTMNQISIIAWPALQCPGLWLESQPCRAVHVWEVAHALPLSRHDDHRLFTAACRR